MPDPEHYRALFRLVGARWLWFSRLTLDDAHLAAIVQHPKVELHTVLRPERPRRRDARARLPRAARMRDPLPRPVPELSGKGHGNWLLAEAVHRAWRQGVDRVHVHTCSLDHPAALAAYLRAGFSPYKRAFERFPDPRLSGSCRGTARLRCRCSARAAEPPPARQLGVDAGKDHQESHRNAALQHLADDGDQQAPTERRARSSAQQRTSRVVTDPTATTRHNSARSRTGGGRRTGATNCRATAPSFGEDGDRPDFSALATADDRIIRTPRKVPTTVNEQQSQRRSDRRIGLILHDVSRRGPSR